MTVTSFLNEYSFQPSAILDETLLNFSRVRPQLSVDNQAVMQEASCYNQARCWLEKRFLRNDNPLPPVTEALLSREMIS
jgi:hypothetical protein